MSTQRATAIGQLDHTIFEFPDVEAILYRIDGSPEDWCALFEAPHDCTPRTRGEWQSEVPARRSDQLEVSHEGLVSASNQSADYFSLNNTDLQCSIYGHPELELLGASGEPLDVAVRTGTSYTTYDPPARTAPTPPWSR